MIKMDKSFFKQQSLQDANKHQDYYKTLSKDERNQLFFCLMQVAYRFVGNEWPKMVKEFTGKRKLDAK